MEKTYYNIVIGCQMNKNDAERIAFYLEDLGFSLAKNELEADLVILVTCGVRQSAEDRIYGLIPKIKRKNKKAKIVLTGCLIGREDVKRRVESKVDIFLPITELSALAGKLGLNKREKGSTEGYLELRAKHTSKFSAFVPIGNGCDNFCTYCVVPYARGRETYRKAENILNEIKALVKRGYKEIILIAQNVNSYKDKSFDFPDLLWQVNKIPGDFWIRFATSHPKDMSDKLIDVVSQGEKICKHIHLPAQSGDNEILRAMNRKYTIEHYLGLIEKIKAKIKNVSLTTDIIVGFPGETKEQFENTKKLFEKVYYDMAYIARYSPRYGTAAYNLDDDVSPREKAYREEELMKILRKTALHNNKKYLNKTVKVLLEAYNPKTKTLIGRTDTSKIVKINNTSNKKIGDFAQVKIIDAQDFGLNGVLK